jgi:hypothetical protein
MTSVEAPGPDGLFTSDSWRWWQARRLPYNVTLAAGGWAAYAVAVGLHYAFGDQVWAQWRAGLGMTLFLGTAYLLVMGVANVCFLLGPAVEGWARPADVDGYRRTAYAMGRWGSLLVPFSFPLWLLAILIARP